MEKLRQLYTDYLEETYTIRKKASAFAGILGLGDDPRKNPCHEKFYNDVDGWMKSFAETEPAAEQAREVAAFLLEEPAKNRETEGYWFMYVCIGFIRNLIPFMEAQDCKVLAERMNALYPKRERMPLQQETFKMLQKAGK